MSKISDLTRLTEEQIDGTELAPVTKGNATFAAPIQYLGRKAAEEASAYAQIAQSAGAPIVFTTAAGIAATSSGQEFTVDEQNGLGTVYLNDGGVAVLRRQVILAPTAPGASAVIGFQATGRIRNVEEKLLETTSLFDFDTIASANADTRRKFVPAGVHDTALTAAQLLGPFLGDGQLRDAGGNKRGSYFTRIPARPSALGNNDDVSTSFNGDLSRVLFPIEHIIDGAGTLGTPASGYLYTQEAAAIFAVSRNNSGHNEQLDDNGGRTSANFAFIKLENYGKGDHAAITVNGFVVGEGPVGAEHWLAMPAIVKLNGTLTAGGHARYLNPYEDDLQLGAWDAAACGPVVNINRSIGDTANGLQAFTANFRAQSKGSYPLDAAFSANGLIKVGLDLTPMLSTAAKAAIATKAGTRFYMDAVSTDFQKATSYGDQWIEYSPLGFFNFVQNNSSVAQMDSDSVRILTRLTLLDVPEFADDAAAAAGGSPVGRVYRTGSTLKIRAA